MIPPTAISTPKMLLSATARPLAIQPRATMEQVLRWPTTVLETGPVCATMKNWDRLIREAKHPDCDGLVRTCYFVEKQEYTYQHYQRPPRQRHLTPHRERVHERDHIEQQERRNRSLVEEQLHAVHLQLLVIATDPDGVQRGGEDAREGEDYAQRAGGLDVRVVGRQAIVVGDHADTEAGRDEGEDGIHRQGCAVEDEVHECHGGCEHDAGHLVECDGREGQ
jgi:hypothetical protein